MSSQALNVPFETEVDDRRLTAALDLHITLKHFKLSSLT